MGGRASLIIVMGFSVALALLAGRLNWIGSTATSNYVAYGSYTLSHDIAQVGVNLGLAKLYQNPWLLKTQRVLSKQTFTSGNFSGGSFIVTIDTGKPSMKSVSETLRSISSYLPPNKLIDTLHDTIVVILKPAMPDSFKILGMMQGFGGAGSDQWMGYDTMDGRFHSNGNVKVFGSSAAGDSAVFKKKATTAKGFVGSADAKFLSGYETGVKTVSFPTDSDLIRVTKPCYDTVSSPFVLPFTEAMTLQFVNPTGANNDGFILAFKGLHSLGTGGAFGSPNQGTNWVKGDSLLAGNILSLVRTAGSAGKAVYAGMFATGTYKYNAGTFVWAAGPTGLAGKSVYAILDDSANNKMYAGTSNGIYGTGTSYGNWVTTSSKIGISGKKVTAMCWNHISPPDSFFIGTADSGVWKVRTTESDNPGKYSNILPKKKITSVAVNKLGWIFAGSPDSLYVSKNRGTTWTTDTSWNAKLKYITSLRYSKDNNLMFLGTKAHGVFKGDTLVLNTGLQWTRCAVLDTVTVPPVSALWTRTTSSTYRLYVGTTGNGVYYSIDSGKTWTVKNTGLTNLGVTAFADSASATALPKLFVGASAGDSVKINDISLLPHGVIYSPYDLSIYGTVDTRKRLCTPCGSDSVLGMLIVSDGNIYLESDLTYENSPVDSLSSSDDMLGVISRKAIYINNSATNGIKDTTQKIWTGHGILFTTSTKPHETMVAKIGTNNNPNWIGRFKTLGGVIASSPLEISWASGGGSYNGFHRSFKWDPRLQLNKKPPCFPTPVDTASIPSLRIGNWWENVRIPKF